MITAVKLEKVMTVKAGAIETFAGLQADKKNSYDGRGF